MVLTNVEREEEVFRIAERLRTSFAETPNPTGQRITISLGISSFYKEDDQPDEIIKRADVALYQSKSNGRNQTTIYK